MKKIEKEKIIQIDLKKLDKEATINKLFKDFQIESLEIVISHMEKILAKKKEQQFLELKQKNYEKALLVQSINTWKNLGVSHEVIKKMVNAKNIEILLDECKFFFIDEKGLIHFWSGQGDVPEFVLDKMKKLSLTQDEILKNISTFKAEDYVNGRY